MTKQLITSLIPSLTPRQVNNRYKIWNHTSIANSVTIQAMFPCLPKDYSKEEFINDLVVALIYRDVNACDPTRWSIYGNITLMNLFIWQETPQGFHFWNILYNEIDSNKKQLTTKGNTK